MSDRRPARVLIRFSTGIVGLLAAVGMLFTVPLAMRHQRDAERSQSRAASAATPVAQAAQRTLDRPGTRMRIVGLFAIPSAGVGVTLEGAALVNDSLGRSRMTLVAPRLPARTAGLLPGGSFAIEEIGRQSDDRATQYLRAPALGPLPAGNRWIGLERGAGEAPSQVPDLLQVLQSLASSGDARALGGERVRGARTTRYAVGGGTEVWVGPDRTIRRIRLRAPLTLGGYPADARVLVTADLFSLRSAPAIAVPDGDAVFDAYE